MKKKLISIFMAGVFLLFIPLSSYTMKGDTLEIDGIFYTVITMPTESANGTVSVANNKDFNSPHLIIPDTITHGIYKYDVVEIVANAFQLNQNIESIMIGNNVTNIGTGVFGECGKLNCAVFGEKLNNMGGSIFYHCSSLKTVLFKAKVKPTVVKNIFALCNLLDAIYVPESFVDDYKAVLADSGIESTEIITSAPAEQIVDEINPNPDTPPTLSLEVNISINPTYTVIIPAAMDLGNLSLQKKPPAENYKTKSFIVKAENVFLDEGFKVKVFVEGDFILSNGDSTVPFGLFKKDGIEVAKNGVLFEFIDDSIDIGIIKFNQSRFTKKGTYKGTLTFKVSCTDG